MNKKFVYQVGNNKKVIRLMDCNFQRNQPYKIKTPACAPKQFCIVNMTMFICWS